MATNVVDGIADLIEADGVVNARVWADDAPAGATRPYVTINDAIAVTKALGGDGRTAFILRYVQVNLWEQLDLEDPAVARRLYACLEGKRITIAGATTTHLSLIDAARLPEVDTNIAHRALTLAVRHDPAAV